MKDKDAQRRGNEFCPSCHACSRLFKLLVTAPCSAFFRSHAAPSLLLRLPHHVAVTRRVYGTLLQRRKRTLRASLGTIGVQDAPYPGAIAYNKKTPVSTSFHRFALGCQGHFYILAGESANCARPGAWVHMIHAQDLRLQRAATRVYVTVQAWVDNEFSALALR